MASEFTHFDEAGRARMVEVGKKKDTNRMAAAKGSVYMNSETLAKVKKGTMEKGDVLSVARIAGVMGAKRTSELIPMCHPLMITGMNINFKLDEVNCKIDIEAQVNITGKTGVEMEALTAVSIAALTIYDMCKAVDKTMTINDIKLIEKHGGKSGSYVNK